MNPRYQRQSFLGEGSQNIIQRSKIGIVGLGGGGSHINQQAAHIGFRHFALYDPQRAEDTNLNRLIGATVRDIGRRKAQNSAPRSSRPATRGENHLNTRSLAIEAGTADGM